MAVCKKVKCVVWCLPECQILWIHFPLFLCSVSYCKDSDAFVCMNVCYPPLALSSVLLMGLCMSVFVLTKLLVSTYIVVLRFCRSFSFSLTFVGQWGVEFVFENWKPNQFASNNPVKMITVCWLQNVWQSVISEHPCYIHIIHTLFLILEFRCFNHICC